MKQDTVKQKKQLHFPGKAWLLLSLFCCLALLAAPAVMAADISVTAELDPIEFSENEAAILTVTVNNAGSATPEVPMTDGLSFSYQGQSSQTQWINGKTSSSISFGFMVQADKAGKYTIAPIRVTVAGKIYSSKAITCTVLPVTVSNAQPAGNQGGQANSNAPSARLRSGEADKIGLMRIIPEKNSIYSGQLVPFTIKAYFRQGMRVTLKSMPRFVGENFMLQSMDDEPAQRETKIKGESYIALTWKGALSAVKEGTFPLVVEMDAELLVPEKRQRRNSPFGSPFMNDPFFADFFGQGQYSRREVKVASPEQSIIVMDLPVAGRPDDFKGAIGSFSMAVAASPLKGKVGDPITLKMNITGKGNFDMVHSPELIDKNSWKTYPATEILEEQSRSSSKKSFEQAIVPTLPDLTAIPALRFSYFDPETEEYVSLSSDPITIQLDNPGAAVMTVQADRGDQKPATEVSRGETAKQDNLAPLHTEPGRLIHAIRPLYQKMWFIVAMAVALFCLLGALLLYLRRKRLEADPSILLHRQVEQQLGNHYKQMEEAIKTQDQNSFLNHCRAAIQQRLGEVWGLEASAITLADLQQRLPADAVLLDTFNRLEHTGYAGKILEQSTLQEMLQSTRNELDKLP